MNDAKSSVYNYDYQKLYQKIEEVFGTQSNFAKALGIGYASLNLKLNNSLEFTQNEILIGSKLLQIEENEIPDYFFETVFG